MKNRKELKKKKRIKLRNKKLIKQYPWLLPRNVWTGKALDGFDYSWHELDGLPDGWLKAFGKFLIKDMGELLKKAHFEREYRIVQVKEKYGCYDDKTEVLTLNGWKYFRDLSYEDQIMTLNPETNEIEYQFPTDIIAEKYKGNMYHIENRGLSIVVTPNHQLYVAKGSYYNGKNNNEKRSYPFELINPEKYFGKDKRFKKGGAIWHGYNPYGNTFRIKGRVYTNTMGNTPTNPNMERTYIRPDFQVDMMAWMRFLGFYVAEGCVDWKTPHTQKARNNGGTVCIAYNPEDEEELVQKLIRDIGFEPKQNHKGNKYFNSVDLAEWLYYNCGHLAWNKKVPDFIKTLPPKYIEEFLRYLYIGDGHLTQTYNILTTTSQKLSNDVQELLLKCGYCFRECIRDRRGRSSIVNHGILTTKHISYEINWLKLSDIEIDNSKSKHTSSFVEEWMPYKDIVYCVTVPNHIIYIRRNGKGVWCGNSMRVYDNGVPTSIYEDFQNVINTYEYISENVCAICGKPDVYMTYSGWDYPLCKHCYEAHINDTRPYEEVISDKDTGKMADLYTIRRFSKEGNKDITYDIHETAEKIRRAYARKTRRSRR